MNREIKFRAWDTKTKTMFYDYAVNNLMDGGIRLPIFHHKLSELYHAQWELMQFTGLFDKKVSPIYEGDILEGDFPLLVVGYHIESASFACSKTTDFSQVQDLYWFFNDTNPKEFEVIGNIYEHKHLLDGQTPATSK